MNARKPRICLIDENAQVRQGWAQILQWDVIVDDYPDHITLFQNISGNMKWECLIMGLTYSHLESFDLLRSGVLPQLRKIFMAPIFLNWQGFISKKDLETYFDGKIHQKFGIKWTTLKGKIQKSQYRPISLAPIGAALQKKFRQNREERCLELLKNMANKADGPFKKQMDFFAFQDPKMGMELLEAIYNRLLTQRNLPENCPSRYINSSPRIAVKILEEALAFPKKHGYL